MPGNIENIALTILLVEDDEGDAWAVERVFQKTKFADNLRRAVDGIEALDMLKGANGKTKIPSPYLLLVDMNMPRMNGIQFVQALREDQYLRHSIIFMLSTSKREEDQIAAYDLNVAGYIVKAKAGQDFMNLANLVDCYWRLVEIL